MPTTDLDILRHQEWLGLLQPVGLVVSPPALVKAQAVIDSAKLVDLQDRLREVVSTEPISHHKDDKIAWIENFPAFTEKVLEWVPEDLVLAEDLPDKFSAVLPSYGETLRPTYGVKDPDSGEWVLLIQVLAPGIPMDEDNPAGATGWKASFQAKFERLLREVGIPAGLLVNGTELRLVYAPSGESSGYLTFPVQAMVEVPGRLILGALDLLIGADRLFNVPENQRLNRLLADSRSYQAEVSTKLASQVLDALWELLRGFQAADAATNGKLLGLTSPPSPLSTRGEGEPEHSPTPPSPFHGEGGRGGEVYGGLITTLMRLVFLLYAEEEGLIPNRTEEDETDIYQRHYAVAGLYEKLREDASNYPDTMDQRYGAWAWLLSLFRLVYDGGGAREDYLPARRGQLFDPDIHPFLEGRPRGSHYVTYGRVDAPRVADGVIYRILDKLLTLDGERLSYRALDVEQIGSVYEAIMGYEVEVAEGLSIALRPKDVVINVETLLAEKPTNRAKVLQDWAECKLTGKGATALKEAKTIDDLLAALGSRISSRTPNLVPPGGLYLQPGEERRRTGSHYTPRKLTQPIVETTLRPIFEQLGDHPTPEQILDLKVCDLAMGSAAFLVEACRQLASKLVEAWDYHGYPTSLTSLPSPGLTSPPSPLSMYGEGGQEGEEPSGSESPSPLGRGVGVRATDLTSPPSPLSTSGEGGQEPENSLTPPSPWHGEGGRGGEVPGYIYALCRELRKEQTSAEGLLWAALRNRQLEGLKFRRQHPLGRYIADFYCAERRLVIELDGAVHDLPDQQEYDRIREDIIRAQNLTVLRFRNEAVETDLEGVLFGIYQAVVGEMTSPPSPGLTSPPSPLSMNGEGEQENPLPPPSPHSGEGGRGGEVDPLRYARRLVAQRCLYGVDKNPFAVNLAKLSLWLVTLSKDQPFTFVDHALKCGDSLVGLTRSEIGAFVGQTQLTLFGGKVRDRVLDVQAKRLAIQGTDSVDDAADDRKRQELREIDDILDTIRKAADLSIVAFFDGKSAKDRNRLAEDYKALLAQGTNDYLTQISNQLRHREHPITPFNWEIEFPEVFDRKNPGFDAIVGNPPFAGKNTIINGNPEGYVDWLKIVHPESHGNADLVAHFFRRAFTITRQGGAFGLIATNTIAQGDTRSTGLRYICNHGGIIYNATRRYRWPGVAAVVVSLVHIWKQFNNLEDAP
ncbi:endonuclease domain-containing protein [Phormidium sp. FACHB-1136]|uniref:endonuclease domain-containing protein n=1 Tax=Phormidium sp. FACHB-1136 TaxID=2692848 RepID=UPI001688ADF5|nr:endonuclease domain-containing protein [Phormidium sp. FACHB-1136]MBD2424671.1 DUF559 domain-containing protein [Phormidium sp. FACHB-1136]